MVLTPIFLSIQALFKEAFIFVLVSEVLITIYVSVCRQHQKNLDNIRNYIHRGIVLLICGLQMGASYIGKNRDPSIDVFHPATPIVLLALLGLDLLLSTVILTWIKFM